MTGSSEHAGGQTPSEKIRKTSFATLPRSLPSDKEITLSAYTYKIL
jgi:hypothetical protein